MMKIETVNLELPDNLKHIIKLQEELQTKMNSAILGVPVQYFGERILTAEENEALETAFKKSLLKEPTLKKEEMKSKYELAEEHTFKTGQDTEDVFISFVVGYETKEKQIIDKINALKSKLAEEKRQKLTKTINQERVKELEVQIKILQELL
jgi:hypothetical protein